MFNLVHYIKIVCRVVLRDEHNHRTLPSLPVPPSLLDKDCVWGCVACRTLLSLPRRGGEQQASSVPDLEEAVPGACGHGHAVVGHAQAAHAVVMAGQHACNIATHYSALQYITLPFS